MARPCSINLHYVLAIAVSAVVLLHPGPSSAQENPQPAPPTPPAPSSTEEAIQERPKADNSGAESSRVAGRDLKKARGTDDGFWGAVPFREGIDLKPEDIKRLAEQKRILSEPAESGKLAVKIEIDADWKLPEKAGVEARHAITVTFANTGADDRTVNMFDTWRFVVLDPAGKELQCVSMRDATRPAEPLTVRAHGKAERSMEVRLVRNDKGVSLNGGDGSGGSWSAPIEQPGAYKLRLHYSNQQETVKAPVVEGFTFWTGKLDTEPLAFKISE